MNMCQAVAKRIILLCGERNLAINRLARMSAVPPSTLKNIVSGVSRNPGTVTIKKLCDGLDISVLEFFDHELFATLEQEIV